MNCALRCCSMILVIWGVILSGCGPPTTSVSLTILQTGCLHGNVYPVSLSHSVPRQTYQYISGYVKSVREEAAKVGAQVVLVDSGNSLGGSFASMALDSKNIATFFDNVGYDAIVLGNRDIHLAKESLREVGVPILTPFRSKHSDSAPAIGVDSVVLRKGRLRIRLFALFCPEQSSEWPFTPASVPPDFEAVRASDRPRSSGHLLNVCIALNADLSRRPDLVDDFVKTGAGVVLADVADSGDHTDPAAISLAPGLVLARCFCSESANAYVKRIDLRQTPQGWRVDRQELVRMGGDVVHADRGVVEAIVSLSQRLAAVNRRVATLNEPKDNSVIRKLIETALDGIQPGAGWILPQENQSTIWETGPLYLSDVFDVIPWDDEVVVVIGLHPDFSELSKYYWIRPISDGTSALVTLRSIAEHLIGDRKVNSSNVLMKNTGTKVYEAVARLLAE